MACHACIKHAIADNKNTKHIRNPKPYINNTDSSIYTTSETFDSCSNKSSNE